MLRLIKTEVLIVYLTATLWLADEEEFRELFGLSIMLL